MAIREKRGKFQVYWNNPFTGKRESKVVADKREAEKLDAQIKYKLAYEREEFRPAGEAEPEAPAPKGRTLEEVHYLYLQAKQFPKKSLYWQLGAMRQAYAAFANLTVDEITREKLESYKSDLMRSGIKPVTVRSKLSVLRTVLLWAHREGMLETVPRFPQFPPALYQHFVPPSRGELARLCRAAPEHLQRVIILGSQLGSRIGPCELFRLKWADVDMERQLVRMPSSRKNLREPWREIPIRESLRPIIWEWMRKDAQDGIEYVIHYKGRPVKNNIQTSWENTLKRAGITRRIRLYDLRHYFATEMIASGIDLGTVAHLMGHTGTNMLVSHYQHVLTRQKRAAVEALPDVPACVHLHVPKKLQALAGGRKGSESLERETGFEPATFSLGSLRSAS